MSTKQVYFCNEGELAAKEVALKPLSPNYVRIQTKAVAGNPIDLMHLQFRLADGTAAGSDVSGVVTEVGSGVSKFAVGDSVSTVICGGDIENPDNGAYSTSVDASEDSLLVHKDLSSQSEKHIAAGPIKTFEQASAVPLILYTAANMIDLHNGTPIKSQSASGFALVYGAGTGVGFAAVQIAKYIGYTVIVTAAKKHHSALQAVGADHLIDYHDSNWIEQVRNIAGDSIVAGFDTVSTEETWNQVHEAVSHTLPAKMHSVKPQIGKLPSFRDNVTCSSTNVYWLFLTRKQFGQQLMTGDESLIAKRAGIVERLNEFLKNYPFHAPTVEIVGSGFEQVPKIYESLKAGMSGSRVVVNF